MPEEPARDAVASVPAPSLFNGLVARLKTLKGAIVAIAGVGAVLGGLAGYWNAYQAARGSTQSSQLLAIVGEGDDEAAIEWLLKALDANPGFTLSRALLAMAYARKGDHARSRTTAAALLQAEPKFSLSKFEPPAGRLAGLPE